MPKQKWNVQSSESRSQSRPFFGTQKAQWLNVQPLQTLTRPSFWLTMTTAKHWRHLLTLQTSARQSESLSTPGAPSAPTGGKDES